jgi:hypothetical protein
MEFVRCSIPRCNFISKNTVNVFSAHSIGGFGRSSSLVGPHNNALVPFTFARLYKTHF